VAVKGIINLMLGESLLSKKNTSCQLLLKTLQLATLHAREGSTEIRMQKKCGDFTYFSYKCDGFLELTLNNDISVTSSANEPARRALFYLFCSATTYLATACFHLPCFYI
jgi:hypothetical protein